MDISYKRHIAKSLTWRLIATIDTILLSWLITGDPEIGLTIGIIEIFTKIFLYYFHERIWYKLNISYSKIFLNSRNRHLIKTFTWRFIGSSDTILISWIVSGSLLSGVKIGFFELTTKMILYYFHERFWYRINFGIIKRKSNF